MRRSGQFWLPHEGAPGRGRLQASGPAGEEGRGGDLGGAVGAYVSRASQVPVTFPYMPKSEIVPVAEA